MRGIDKIFCVHGVDSATSRLSRTSEDVAAVGYTISEFMSDNGISKDALTIADECYPRYAAAVREFIKEHRNSKT